MDLVRGFFGDLVHLPLMFKLVLLWMAGAAGWSWWKQRQKAAIVAASVTWPVYRARVIAAQVMKRKGSSEDRGLHEGVLTYSYTVPGKELEVGEFRKSFLDEIDADLWASGFKDGFVDVRVDPDDAKRSVWDEAAYVAAPMAKVAPADRMGSGAVRATEHGTALVIVFWISTMAVVLSAAIQLSCLLGKPLINSQHKFVVFIGMLLVAILVGVEGQFRMRRSRLARARTGQGQAFAKSGGSRPTWTKLLDAYSLIVWLYCWVRISSATNVPD